MKPIEAGEPTEHMTLYEMLERFGIDYRNHLGGLAEFMEELRQDPTLLVDEGDNSGIFAEKLLDALNLDQEQLAAALEHRKQYRLRQLQ